MGVSTLALELAKLGYLDIKLGMTIKEIKKQDNNVKTSLDNNGC